MSAAHTERTASPGAGRRGPRGANGVCDPPYSVYRTPVFVAGAGPVGRQRRTSVTGFPRLNPRSRQEPGPFLYSSKNHASIPSQSPAGNGRVDPTAGGTVEGRSTPCPTILRVGERKIPEGRSRRARPSFPPVFDGRSPGGPDLALQRGDDLFGELVEPILDVGQFAAPGRHNPFVHLRRAVGGVEGPVPDEQATAGRGGLRSPIWFLASLPQNDAPFSVHKYPLERALRTQWRREQVRAKGRTQGKASTLTEGAGAGRAEMHGGSDVVADAPRRKGRGPDGRRCDLNRSLSADARRRRSSRRWGRPSLSGPARSPAGEALCFGTDALEEAIPPPRTARSTLRVPARTARAPWPAGRRGPPRSVWAGPLPVRRACWPRIP